MENHSIFKSNRCCVIITGASKGFGRILAKKFAHSFFNQFSNDKESILKFILIARNENELDSLANELRSIDSRCNMVTKIVTDLAETKAIDDINKEFEQNLNITCPNLTVNDAAKRHVYYRLNLYSIMEMTSVFLRQIKTHHCHIINVSSLAAIKPMPGLLDYCVGKAAREAYFKQLANELITTKQSKTKYRILNYAPGPLDTEMFRQLQQESTLQKQFQETIPLKPEDSANKLLQILYKDEFADAAHVDYYD
ncbi:hypothetical protein DERF_009747 [Dermatophagoides farinae]|uniref:Sepiapterin reductase n=1 Tax=Dermatophagoides farinae TaxID=6954 RepID=A0A922HXX1_DERFA|nr:hypothetical protein DERF_009747 [Dermatophagoides farinae]